MIRILKKLLPSYSLKHSENSILNNSALISINIDDSFFLLEISFDRLTKELLLKELQNSLSSLHPKQDLRVHFLPDTPIDYLNTNKKSFTLSNQQQQFSLFLPLEFVVYLSNKLEYTYFCKATNFYDLELELYRFQPSFLSQELWLSLPQKDLQDLFYYMITNNLATPKMFALFLKKIELPNISLYFSKNIFQEIQKELDLLSNLENPNLLASVYYIIENNLMSFLQQLSHVPSALLPFYKTLQTYQKNIYIHALMKLDLKKLPYFDSLANSKRFSLFINQIPYQSLLSFLQHSKPSNKNIINKGFSLQGQKQLLQDMSVGVHPILKSNQCVQHIAQLTCENNPIPFEDLVNKLMTKTRDWELLARECDIRDLLLCLDTLSSKDREKIGGILSILYQSYHQKIIIFPKITERSIIQAQKYCSIAIYKLYFLKILDYRLEIF